MTITATSFLRQCKARKSGYPSRVSVTGETPSLLERFDEIHHDEVESCRSPFDDAPWAVDKGLGGADLFKITVAALFAVPQILLVYPLLLVLLLPPVACNLAYVLAMVPGESDYIPRTAAWKVHCFVQAILCIPATIVAMFSLSISRFAMILSGTLYCAVAKGGFQRYHHNLDVIKPYRDGPPLYLYFPDCIAAVAGMVHRRGLMEFTSSFALMFVVNPWVKYWITGNIYTDDMRERFVTQVGRPMKDMTSEQVASHFRVYLSRAKHGDADREYIRNPLFFCPHFPFPPRDGRRKWAVGLEHSTIACFVHTRHFETKSEKSSGNVRLTTKDPLHLSRSAEIPVYRVILWRNNPYHIYTGVVEACISRKQSALEHPMWLITSHDKLAAGPMVVLSTGWIGPFFDEFIPALEYFIRSKELGREATDVVAKLHS